MTKYNGKDADVVIRNSYGGFFVAEVGVDAFAGEERLVRLINCAPPKKPTP